jgi:uncharacterized membrane protein (UPF0127 family)
MRRARVTFPSGASALVEVAATERDRAEGLAGWVYLPRDAGVLFVFDSWDPGPHDFTTADMRFPIDVVAVRGGRVARVVSDLAPGLAAVPVLGEVVLEVGAGWCRERGVRVGDAVEVRML